jgi:pimeloyl-ACP methyl ester carboxylesterase
MFAGAVHNCFGRLSSIAAPTLVVHGRHDRMIPVDNGRLIAERIPEARLRILEESGHLYPTEEPEVDDAIEAFLTAKGEEVR